MDQMICPCSSGQQYRLCCARYLEQGSIAEDAEHLMRSRYCAYVFGQVDYLQATWQAGFRPSSIQIDQRIKWIGLQIIKFAPGAEQATVEFEAKMLVGNRVEVMHECSSFVKEQGRWFYTDGVMLVPLSRPWSPQSNQACPCASGKKFKRCCRLS
ncbi:MAG: SEC-C motif-containing protein [Gammaproteobacteria bacterium]|jgi:SEC-C motif-containing protein